MKSSNRIVMAATLTGLLAAAPALLAQSQGTTSTGSQTGTSGSHSSMSSSSSKMSHSSSSSMSGSSKLSSSDKKFVMEAAAGGMEEVQLGQIAAQKASDPDVKSFGQRMVDDHTKANDQLKQVASQKGVTVPSSLPASKQKDVDKLNKLNGAAFDSAYVSMMVKDHKKDVADFQKESKSAKDSDVKSFASTTLPTLQDHLKMIQDISSKMHPTKSAKMSKKGR
jgi:putative membrane protein